MLVPEGDREALSPPLPPPVASVDLVGLPVATLDPIGLEATGLEATASGGSLGIVRRNLVWMLLSQVVTWSVSIVILIAAPRRLGDAQFGELAFATAYIGFFQLVALLGTNMFIQKEVARDHSRLGPLVVNTLVMKALLCLTLAAMALGLAYILDYSSQMITIVALMCVFMTTNVLNDVVISGLQGMERMTRPAIWAVVEEIVICGLGLAVLLTNRGLTAYVATVACCGFVSLVPNFLQLWPSIHHHVRVRLRTWFVVAKGGLPYLSWAAILLVYGSIDIVLLNAMTNSQTVGWYALAYRWVGLPVAFAAIVTTAFFPSLANHGEKDPGRFADLANRAIRLVAFVGVPIAAGIAVVARPVLGILYPSEFEHTIPIMQILALHIPFVGIDMVLGTALIARDRQRQWLFIGCLAAVANPLMNVALIPLTVHLFSNGAIGAAIATVATEALMMAGAIRLRPSGVLDGTTTRFIWRVILAGAAIVPVVLLVRHGPLAIQVIVGVLAYALASLVVRTVSPQDIRKGTRELHNAFRVRVRVRPLNTTE
jgi:PST family polysaccharide transporter